jgi:hypothetical protein
MCKMGSHDPFRHVQHKLWQKERLGVKLVVWLPITKCQESTQFPCVQVACDTPLKKSRRELQLCFRPCPDWMSEHEVIALQSCRSSNHGSFRTPFRESQDKKPFGCSPRGEVQSILLGEGGGFPWARAMVSLVSPKSLVVCPSTKDALTQY